MQKITLHLWFDKQAKEAAQFYVEVFSEGAKKFGGGESKIISVQTLTDTPSGTVDVVSFELSGQPFMAISAGPLFTFNESISFIIPCETQEEIDYYWEKLSAVPESEQCGWLKDKYGLSWQVVPTALDEMMSKGTPEQIQKVTQAFLKMKKFDIEQLQKAYKG